MRARYSLVACLGLVAFFVTVRLEAEDSGLGKYVPAGVHFYGNWTPTAASGRFNQPFGEAWKKLVDSGIGEDIFDLVTLELGSDMRETARAKVAHFFKLLSAPDWSALASKELVFAFRISIPIPEYLVLCRGENGTADTRVGELRQLLEGVAAFAPEFLSVTDSTLNGAKVVRLGAGDVPVALSVASKGGVVAISTSDILLDSSLRLMDAEDASDSIVESQRFRDSQTGLPEEAMGKSFFDFGGYTDFIRGMMGMAQGFQVGKPEAAILAVIRTFSMSFHAWSRSRPRSAYKGRSTQSTRGWVFRRGKTAPVS